MLTGLLSYFKSSYYVAVKIKKAKDSVKNSKLSILHYLNLKRSFNKQSMHIIFLLNFFEKQGSKRKHLYFISKALGPGITTVLEWTPLYQSIDRARINCYRFLLCICKKILKQVFLEVTYLHAYCVVHRDIYAGNVLFATTLIFNTD